MNEKNSNFIITDDKDVRKTLMSWNLLEIHNNDGMYVFVNEPKKLRILCIFRRVLYWTLFLF